MSFADELRNAPEERQKREKEQSDHNFDLFIEAFYEDIKKTCKRRAEDGYNYDYESVSDFIKNVQEYQRLYSSETIKRWECVKSRIARQKWECDIPTGWEYDLVEDDAKKILPERLGCKETT